MKENCRFVYTNINKMAEYQVSSRIGHQYIPPPTQSQNLLPYKAPRINDYSINSSIHFETTFQKNFKVLPQQFAENFPPQQQNQQPPQQQNYQVLDRFLTETKQQFVNQIFHEDIANIWNKNVQELS